MNKNIFLLFFFLILVLFLAGCNTADSPQPTPLPPIEIIEASRYIVERGRIEQTLQFAGRTAPIVEEPLLFAVNGTVTEVLLNAGTAVSTGEIIARLEARDLAQQMEEAQLALRAAELRRTAAEQENAAALAAAQLSLQQARLTTNAAEITAAEVALENAGSAGARRLAEAQLTDAQNRAAAQALIVAQIEAEIATLEQVIRQLQQGEAGQTTIDIEQAELTIHQLEQAIAARTLVAPFDGILQTLDVRPGDEVAAFDRVGTVVDTAELDITAEISPADSNQLSIGQPVTVQFSNRDGSFTGTIGRLPTFGAADRRVRIALVDPPADLQQGELATMTALLAAADDVLLLPTAAVRTYQGRTFVLIETADGSRRRADVQLGISDGLLVEIIAGVTEGETVVGE
jgi:multidrug resistance efflux pump